MELALWGHRTWLDPPACVDRHLYLGALQRRRQHAEVADLAVAAEAAGDAAGAEARDGEGAGDDDELLDLGAAAAAADHVPMYQFSAVAVCAPSLPL